MSKLDELKESINNLFAIPNLVKGEFFYGSFDNYTNEINCKN